MVSVHSLQRSVALRVVVPLMLCFVVVGSVFFDYLAQDLTVNQISEVKDWHFLMITAPIGILFMIVWYIQVCNYLADVQAGKTPMYPMEWIAYLALVLQVLNTIVSVLFIIGASTTWFTAQGNVTDAIRIYTIIIGVFGIMSFGLSSGLGFWVKMNVSEVIAKTRQTHSRIGYSYEEENYESTRNQNEFDASEYPNANGYY